MKFSIIIINYKTKELTGDCIDSVFNIFKSEAYEIILVDNDSKDGSVEYFEQKFGDKIIIIANNYNAGFGKANNIASQKAKGEYLFFLNSDTIITSDFLREVLILFNNDSKFGIVAPKLLMENNKEQEYAYGKFPNFLSIITKNSNFKNNDKNEVDWLSGAAFIVKKELFERVKGFDDNFFMYFEDIDLCKKVNDLGYRNMTISSISLIHLGGKSAVNFSRKKMYYISQSYYFKKHFGLLSMFVLNITRWPYKIYKLLK